MFYRSLVVDQMLFYNLVNSYRLITELIYQEGDKHLFIKLI